MRIIIDYNREAGTLDVGIHRTGIEEQEGFKHFIYANKLSCTKIEDERGFVALLMMEGLIATLNKENEGRLNPLRSAVYKRASVLLNRQLNLLQ